MKPVKRLVIFFNNRPPSLTYIYIFIQGATGNTGPVGHPGPPGLKGVAGEQGRTVRVLKKF